MKPALSPYHVAPYRSDAVRGWIVVGQGDDRKSETPNVFATEAAAQAEADRLNGPEAAPGKQRRTDRGAPQPG